MAKRQPPKLISDFIDFLRAFFAVEDENENFTPAGSFDAEMVREIFWTVKDPVGHLIHTVVSIDEPGAIHQFMQTEQACNLAASVILAAKGKSAICTQSWEQFEAEGYACVPVHLIEVQKKLLDEKIDKV